MNRTAPFPKLKRGLVAILRGLTPQEAVAIGQAIHAAGIEAIEVPLNSPEPFASIEQLVAALPKTALVGAVGGVSEKDFSGYRAAGVGVFGLGSSLFKPGMSAAEVGERARGAVAGWDAVFGAG
jgi:2-dehydro-3-deoxyphosphogalactonate aldolase